MSSQHLLLLPEELLVEILSWVSVKALMRFRCVSKWWNSLVLDPTFVKLHLQRSSKDTHVLLTFEDDNDESKYCAPCSVHGLLENPSSTIDGCHQFNHDYSVLGVCNGLVCLRDSYLGDEFEKYWVRFWNPATRVISEDSPRIRLSSRDYEIGWYSLLFGFGYDDRSDTYKVVAVLSDIKSHRIEVRLHCLGDTCWRNILTCPAFPILAQDGQFVSGTVNWLALRKLGSEYQWKTVSINELVIFSYDLKNDTYRYLSLPDGLIEVPHEEPILEVLKGCLSLYHHHGRTHFVVWLMREFGDKNSWTQLLKVSYEHLHIAGSLGFPPTIPVILCMSENDDVLLLATYGGSEIILYNKRDNGMDRHEDFVDGKCSFLSYDYVQSLVVPHRI